MTESLYDKLMRENPSEVYKRVGDLYFYRSEGVLELGPQVIPEILRAGVKHEGAEKIDYTFYISLFKEGAIPYLERALESKDGGIFLLALRSLSNYEKELEPKLKEKVFGFLDSEDPDVREEALLALYHSARINQKDRQRLVTYLNQFLEGDYTRIKEHAIHIIITFKLLELEINGINLALAIRHTISKSKLNPQDKREIHETVKSLSLYDFNDPNVLEELKKTDSKKLVAIVLCALSVEITEHNQELFERYLNRPLVEILKVIEQRRDVELNSLLSIMEKIMDQKPQPKKAREELSRILSERIMQGVESKKLGYKEIMDLLSKEKIITIDIINAIEEVIPKSNFTESKKRKIMNQIDRTSLKAALNQGSVKEFSELLVRKLKESETIRRIDNILEKLAIIGELPETTPWEEIYSIIKEKIQLWNLKPEQEIKTRGLLLSLLGKKEEQITIESIKRAMEIATTIDQIYLLVENLGHIERIPNGISKDQLSELLNKLAQEGLVYEVNTFFLRITEQTPVHPIIEKEGEILKRAIDISISKETDNIRLIGILKMISERITIPEQISNKEIRKILDRCLDSLKTEDGYWRSKAAFLYKQVIKKLNARVSFSMGDLFDSGKIPRPKRRPRTSMRNRLSRMRVVG